MVPQSAEKTALPATCIGHSSPRQPHQPVRRLLQPLQQLQLDMRHILPAPRDMHGRLQGCACTRSTSGTSQRLIACRHCTAGRWEGLRTADVLLLWHHMILRCGGLDDCYIDVLHAVPYCPSSPPCMTRLAGLQLGKGRYRCPKTQGNGAPKLSRYTSIGCLSGRMAFWQEAGGLALAKDQMQSSSKA